MEKLQAPPEIRVTLDDQTAQLKSGSITPPDTVP